jgi:hypothetical protein
MNRIFTGNAHMVTDQGDRFRQLIKKRNIEELIVHWKKKNRKHGRSHPSPKLEVFGISVTQKESDPLNRENESEKTR